MSLLSDLFGDGSMLDKLHTPQGWTVTEPIPSVTGAKRPMSDEDYLKHRLATTSPDEARRQLQDDPTGEKYFLRKFYDEVCAEAENIMSHTNTVTGAHYNAMKRVLKRHGVEVE